MWNGIYVDKKKYNRLAEKDKERYGNDLKIYKSGDKKEHIEDDSEEDDSEEEDLSDVIKEKMDSSISEDNSSIINGNSSNSSTNTDDS